MKHIQLFAMILLFLIGCAKNPVEPEIETEGFNLEEEAKNIPWESISGKIVYKRRVGYLKQAIILVDGERRGIKILKTLPYVGMITWHYTGTKITGADLGEPSILSEGRSRSFFCIDLNGNYSTTNYSPAAVHSWSNDGKVASLKGGWFVYPSLYINQQLFLSSSDYSFSLTRPTWSADNNYLVASIVGSYYLGHKAELKKFDINTKIGITLVVAESVGYNFSFENPIYSPDGNKIAYVYSISLPDTGHGSRYKKEIWVVNSDGSNKMRLTTGYNDTFPVWSPDGLKLIFQRNTIENLTVSKGIFLINLDRAGLQKILSKGSDMPIWN
jgi:hypothetical protein